MQSVSPKKESKRILLVDNDPRWYNLVKGILESEGYEVLVAMSETTALSTMQSGSFHLLLVNLHLEEPSLSSYSKLDYKGVQVVDAIPQYAPYTPCIVYSGLSPDPQQRLGSPLWCTSVHKTKASLDELLTTIRQVLDGGVLMLRLTRIRRKLYEEFLPIEALEELVNIVHALSRPDDLTAVEIRLHLLKNLEKVLRKRGTLTPEEEASRREAIAFALDMCTELEVMDRARRAIV